MRKAIFRTVVTLCVSASVLGTSSSIALAEERTEYVVSNKSENSLGTPHLESISIQPLSEDGIEREIETPNGSQFEWSIQTPESSHQSSFKVKASGDVQLAVDETSGALTVNVDGETQALIDAPWAHGANGEDLATHYEVDGDTFTQYVEPAPSKSAYPITADPRVNWGKISGHIYFSKEETRRMGASTAAAFAVTPFWVLVPPPVGEVLGVWWGAHASEISAWSAAAIAQNKCLALKVGVTGGWNPPSIGVSPEHYTNGCA
ncbi:hypothetical protein [Corynebacterium sp. HMSC068G04]|uniref:hypothetical protein n=1 Tax=Corynebacterium sp. HMSC068G04 TaxID=1739497 RepID=UPI00114D2A1E|nr:hypothetical protein [Corynebacterium sp. HMSC068G04]